MEALVSLGSRWENRSRETEALLLYQQILAVAPAGAEGMDRVRRRSEALQGRGAIGGRFEVAARNFVRHAADPAMIFGFMVAGGMASLARGFVMGQLAARAPSLLTRAWAARTFAAGAGIVVEVPALVGATRLAHGLLGYEEGFGRLDTLAQELGGAALFLGALKFSAWGARALAPRTAFAPLVLGGGTLGGIYLGHRLQEGFGLRPAQDELNRWFDSAETFLQLRAGGQLNNALLGTRSPIRELALRERMLELRPPVPRPLFGRMPTQVYEAAAIAAAPDDEVTQQIPRLSSVQPELIEGLGSRATSQVLQAIEGIHQQMHLGEPWLRLLRSSQYQDIYGFELALRRLQYASLYTRPQGLTGSYLNWLSRVALVMTVQRQDQPRFDRLLTFLAEGGPVEQVETIISEMAPERRLFSEHLITRTKQVASLVIFQKESYRLIRQLPLFNEARQSLINYGRLLPAEEDRLACVRLIRNWLEMHPEHRELANAVLVRARLNPIGSIRIDRFIRIIENEASNAPKLRELVDADLGGRGRGNLNPGVFEPEDLLGTQNDGYIGDPDLAQELSHLYRALPAYFDVNQAATRQTRTHEILQEVWPSNRAPLNADNFHRALRLFGDPISTSIADDIEADRFRLVMLGQEELKTVRRSIDRHWKGGDFTGLFISAERDASGRDSIYLLQSGPASHARFRDQALQTLSNLVHEHTHLTRASNQVNRNLRGVYVEEMLSETRRLHWLAEQGHSAHIRHFQEINPGGLGLFLADWANLIYFIRQDETL